MPVDYFYPTLKRLILFLFILIASNGTLFAKSIKVSGKVMDAETGAIIPFASVVLKSSGAVIPCDSVGEFQFTFNGRTDALIVAALGYVADTILLSPLSNQFLKVKLESTSFSLSEVTVHLGENPAFEILRKVIANKSINDPEFVARLFNCIVTIKRIKITNIKFSKRNPAGS